MHGVQVLAADTAWQAINQQVDIPVAIDSRMLEQGDFFIALKGLVVDAHTFLQAVLEKGACGALIARDRVHLIAQLAPDFVANKFLLLLIIPKQHLLHWPRHGVMC